MKLPSLSDKEKQNALNEVENAAVNDVLEMDLPRKRYLPILSYCYR